MLIVLYRAIFSAIGAFQLLLKQPTFADRGPILGVSLCPYGGLLPSALGHFGATFDRVAFPAYLLRVRSRISRHLDKAFKLQGSIELPFPTVVIEIS